MKLKYLLLIVLSCCLISACDDEESIIPRDVTVEPRYIFPQGTGEWDEIANTIKEKHDVYVIYKNFSSLDISRAWTVYSGRSYFGDFLTDEQANTHIHFMKEHIFDYLPVDLTRSVLPLYYFLINNYRSETVSITSVSKANITNFVDGLDYWVNSIYTETVTQFPNTWEKLREHRVRIMKLFFEAAINRGVVKIPASFHDGFDYTKALVTYPATDPNSPLNRGFLGTLSGDIYNFGGIYGISYTNPELNFLTYVFLGMRYTEEEFLANSLATYPLVVKKRLEVINYMKEKYHVDLEAIARGPEL